MASSIRLFVAVNIPESMKEKIYPIGAFLPRDAVKPVEKDNLHITIKFLGEVPDFRLGDIASELEKVKFTRFNVALHGVGVFPSASNARVVWVGCESKELYHLAKKINDILGQFGENEPFSAHLTVARVRKKFDPFAFLEKYGHTNFGEFEVSSFELMQSVLGKSGPDYSVVSSFSSDDK